MIQRFHRHSPIIHPTARLTASAALVGCVAMKAASSIWYGAILQKDESSIHVGAGSNIQDNAVLHYDPGYPAVIDHDVTIGHDAILYGCSVENTCLTGMGTILLNGRTIGADSLVATGALVTQRAVAPPGSLVVGSLAGVVRSLQPEGTAKLLQSAETCRALSTEPLPTAEVSETGGSV